MTYATEVHSRIAAAFARETPAHISVVPHSDEYEAQREHIEKVASLFDEYMHALAIDAAEGSDKINPKEWAGAVSTALSDQSLTYQYTEAAEALREDEPRERSDFEEHNTMSRAYQGV